MARNPEGEYELVLGNKQLLSLFFLVVVLFAVFFSLGYIVGKAVAPAQTMAAQPVPAAGNESGISPLPPAENPSPKPAAPTREAAPVVTETEPARTETVSATAAPPAAAASSVAAASPGSTPAAPASKPANAEPATEPEASGAVIARELHLQVAAVHVREDAEALVESLQKKGYKAVLNTQGRDGWYRILLGPFANERAAMEMKAALEKDGYKSILRRP